nr:MBL fold metallo-hydrolase [Deinococcus cavernae]
MPAERGSLIRYPPEMHGAQERFHRSVRGMVVPAKKWTLLKENDGVPLVGRDWQVLWLPGHADGHLGLWQPEESLLIAADAILPRITPNIGLYAYSRPDPLADYLDTLDSLTKLAPQRAIVGHHGPVMSGVTERAQVLRAHHAERLEFLKNAVGRAPGSAWEMSRVMFPRPLNEANLRFALAETLAHLEHLHLQGQVGRVEEGGVVRFIPV